MTEQQTPASQTERWPHRVIRRGEGPVRPLPPHARQLGDLRYPSGDARFGNGDYMARCSVAALLVLKDGEVALERYAEHTGPERRRTSYSTAKTITATLVGAALHDGAIASLDERCDRYLPRLAGSAYASVTIRNLLRMASGVAWRELGEDQSDVARLDRALATRQAGSILDLACALPHAHAQGVRFNYSTVESGVLGAVLAAATGRTLADYCAEKIWGPAGMEADGYWALDGDDGHEIGGAGVNARLRDFARFGLLLMDDGVGAGGRRVLPPGWRDLASQPDCAATAFGALMPGNPAGYGYQCWVPPHQPTGIHRGAFSAIGAYGQYIYVNPAAGIVVAINSEWPANQDHAADAETFDLVGAVVRALR